MIIEADKFDETLAGRWRQIDDVAKNGSYYLIGWMAESGQKLMHVAFWHRTKQRWVGAVEYSPEQDSQPTHYMLLPAPAWAVPSLNQFGIPAGDYRQFNFTEHLAQWMLSNGFTTGHGDSFISLLDELEWQVAELRDRTK